MDDFLKNKVVVVTGGARGIGKNVSRAFCQNGAVVVICDIHEPSAKQTCFELQKQGLKADYLKLDLSRVGAPQKMLKTVVKTKGRLDVLVNNVRFSAKRMALFAETQKSWATEMEELKTAFFASQEAIRHMTRVGKGSIVNISSVAAVLTCHQSPAYHAAKAGLLQLTRYLAMEGGPSGVRVNAVMPGFIVKDEDRQRFESANNKSYKVKAELCHPLRRVGFSDDVAQAVLFLSSDRAAFITGHFLTVDGGLSLQEQSGLVFRLTEKKKRKA